MGLTAGSALSSMAAACVDANGGHFNTCWTFAFVPNPAPHTISKRIRSHKKTIVLRYRELWIPTSSVREGGGGGAERGDVARTVAEQSRSGDGRQHAEQGRRAGYSTWGERFCFFSRLCDNTPRADVVDNNGCQSDRDQTVFYLFSGAPKQPFITWDGFCYVWTSSSPSPEIYSTIFK